MPQVPGVQHAPPGLPECTDARTRSWSYLQQLHGDASHLPSTVDVNALKSGPPDITSKSMESSSSSTDSDGTSSSTESDSSTASENPKRRKSPTQAPQFSVTSSDKSGLKMKIAAIPRGVSQKALNNNSSPLRKANDKKKVKSTKAGGATTSKKSTTDASSSSSCCSACNGSESDSSSDENTNAKQQKLPKKQKKLRRKKANRSASTSSGGRTDSSDSESSDEVLQEINPEDLAAILPTESFNEFDNPATSGASAPTQTSSTTQAANASRFGQVKIASSVPSSLTDACADGGSSSDMELPAIVNAAIQLVENCSDSEASGRPSAPPVTYNSPLLLDFMVKTQMLGKTSSSLAEETSLPQGPSGSGDKGSAGKLESESLTPTASSSGSKSTAAVATSSASVESKENVPVVEVKRKRGRPKKNPTIEKPAAPAAKSATTTSGSPDSGILSITQSPSHSPRTEAKRGPSARSAASGSARKVDSVPVATRKTPVPTTPTKINISSLDKSMYATERVLYPPRGRRRGPGRPPTKSKEAKKEETVDPMWRKIDINKKFRRPSVSGYKSDGGTVCSKVLASQSGYTSDYGAVRRRRLSGYRSDYSTKSKKSGYRSDYSVKAKSCGYRSDCSIRHRKKVRRKRRTKTNSQKSAVTEQDILQLAGLSLGQSSEENSVEAVTPVAKTSENLFSTSTFNGAFSAMARSLKVGQNHSLFSQASNSKMSLKDVANRKSVALDGAFGGKSKSLSTFGSISAGKSKGAAKRLDDSVCSFGSLLQQSGQKGKEVACLKSPARAAAIRSRRSSAVSRCSSRSTMSRHHLRRRRRKRLRSRNESVASRVTDAKFLQELDQLIASFGAACHISAERSVTKESAPKTTSKRATKKRKVAETADSPSTSGGGGKRRHKKTQSTQSPDDHKLPLKKRHYLLTPGEKSDSKMMAEEAKGDPGKMPPRAVTPKKRHLIEKQDPPSIITDEISSAIKSSNSPITIDTKTTDSSEISVVDSGANLRSRRSDIMTRKKNRLEGLVSKMQASPSGESQSEKSHSGRPSVISKISASGPPPGVFEPSIDLELQIPVSTIIVPSLVTKTEALDSPRVTESIGTVDTNESLARRTEKVVETLLSKTRRPLTKRKRRKTINRTGFPSVKKKKKITRDNTLEVPWNDGLKETQVSPKVHPLTVENVKKIAENCDRVPKVGETADIFMERNNRPRLSVVSLERLQGKIPEESSSRMVINPFGVDRKTRKSIANGEIPDLGKRQLRTRHRDESSEQKKRDRDSSQESPTVSTIAKKFKEEETSKQRDQSSDNEPLINLVKPNERKRPRRKGVSALIDNLTPNELLPESAKRTRLQSEIEKKNKLEAEMQPVVKLESMDGSSGIILGKRTTSRSSSVALFPSSSPVERSPRPKSRMEVKLSPLAISREASKDNGKVATKEMSLKVSLKIPEPRKELPKVVSKETERTTRNRTANTVAKPALESKEKEKVVEKEKPKEKLKEAEKEKSSVKTRAKDKSVERKPVDLDEMSLEKRQQVAKSPKKIEKYKDAKAHESPVKMKSPDVKPSVNTQSSPQLMEELEQEPLPISEGPSRVPPREDSPVSVASEKSGRKFSRWKKKYLNAGLLSDTFKEEEGKKHSRSEEGPSQILLPPPPYCERFFRKTQRDFLLPYDLWWAHENQKLPGRNSVPSWNYKKIRTNVYIDVKANPRTDQPSCSCNPSTGCGEDCLNRVVYTECNSESCPCGDKCQNTKIQKHEYSPGLERYMTANKGWGVRTRLPIKKGNFILEYVGEVVTEREFKERMATLYVRDTHHYCLHLDGGLVIDGHRMGSDGRFVNHSCAPNCEMQKWSVNGLPRMVLFAARDIKAGEELTYDYNFALYNPTEGQPCLCESSSCRGVIGGKSQRVKPPPVDQQSGNHQKASNGDDAASRGRSRKRTAKKNLVQNTGKDRSGTPLFQVPSNKELIIIKESHCFLMRNLGKIRRLKERLTQQPQAPVPSPVTLLTRITELRAPRNIRTRGLTVGDHDPQIDKMAKMAAIFKDLCRDICSFKESGPHYAINKLALPAKKKLPQYYEVVTKPIDMAQIEANVERGVYKNPAMFDEDVQRLFKNAIQFYPATSDEMKIAQNLLTLFTNKKQLVYPQLLEIVDDKETLKGFQRSKVNELVLKAEPNEDVIQCICGLFKDEGLMIQCSDCQVWQHTECTKADTEAESYRCEKCDPRPVNLEIPLEEFTDEGYRYYLSLLRGDLHIRQTDTVYVLRDIPMDPDPKNSNSQAPRKHTYETIGDIDYSECDIFRVERLWKDNNGKRFVFGHHYLRPHETYHEPSRKFYPNEVVRVPLYEVVPIELIMARCWVLDVNTYCKGRPVDSEEDHIYICELRVDKGARFFSKVSKQANPVCTKSYAFRKYEQRLKISRTYAPHDLGPMPPKQKKRKEEIPIASRKNSTSIIQLMPPPPKTLHEKRSRLEETLTRLMNRLKSTKPESLPAMDLSYLLTGRGARQRRANATSVPV
ncbi:histone-lysine N-methyltransferase ash1 [Phlebotomus argentipes]|uniref:histone-lysine N-methyltransferase ash1 n=1 Tax=Phlebotomus argentipes TaxID=94469 RepID=UPI002893459E|nr:histone-lysine N-methyltransferase ash1 [Phlebotomus argentipes]